METKCLNCNNIINKSNITFSCSHYLCSKCLSRKLLLEKFRPLATIDSIELTCSCKGKANVSFKNCLESISEPEIQKKKNGYAINAFILTIIIFLKIINYAMKIRGYQ